MMRLRRARTASRRLPARDTAPGVSSCNVPRRSARESDERVGAYSRHLSQSFCSSSARDPIDREETRSAIPAVPTIISAIPIPCVGLVVGWLGGLLSLAVLWRPGAPSSPRVDPPRIPFGNAAQVRRGPGPVRSGPVPVRSGSGPVRSRSGPGSGAGFSIGSEKARRQKTLVFPRFLNDFGFSGASLEGSLAS